MSAISKIPDSIQNKSSTNRFAQLSADQIDADIKAGDNAASGPMKAQVDSLRQVTDKDPSLKQYLSTGVQALLNYDGKGGSGDGRIPQAVVDKSARNKQAQTLSDTITQELKDGQDPGKGKLKEDIDALKKITDKDSSLKQYLTATTNALLEADKEGSGPTKSVVNH